MADIDLLNAVQSQQTEPSNQDVVDAVHQSQWANTFQNTPPAEVLRSRVNLADTVNRAFDNKLALAARSDAGALNLMQKNAQFQEFQRQAPLREQLLQAHIDATGATERRKAAEAISQANDTSGLNSDIAAAYGNGIKPGTPEFQQTVFSSIAQHPHADPSHLREVHKLAGGPDDVDPVAFAQSGMAVKQAMINAGFPNATVKFANGQWEPSEGANPKAVGADHVADIEDQIANPVSLTFGHLDAKGNVVPDVGSDAKATHVVASFINPKTGGVHDTRPMTVQEYQTIADRAKARKSAPAAVPTAAPTDSAVVPVVPAEPGLNTPEEVRAAYRAGALPRDKAEAILKNKFGHT